jgi:RNA polymerase sigma factor (sigma-70 family)
MTRPTKRPASFDERIVAYRPGLYSLARRLGFDGDRREELVQDTCVSALSKWENYREDGGMWNWLYWQMRHIAYSQARLGRLRIATGATAERQLAGASTAATQQVHVELACALRKVTGRDGDILMRRAMGDSLREIGEEKGISYERVRQLEERARSRVVCGEVG